MMWRKRQTSDKLATNVHHNEQNPGDLVNIVTNLSIQSDDLSIKREKAMREVQRLGQEIEQEPVAWQWLDTAHFRKKLPKDAGDGVWNPLYAAPQRTERPVDCERCNRLEEQAYDLVGKLRVANIKLSMQPQRTWVGLTEEELCEIVGVSTNDSDWNVYKVQEWLRKVEAKLKEKNT
jgi:hypothetical protein